MFPINRILCEVIKNFEDLFTISVYGAIIDVTSFISKLGKINQTLRSFPKRVNPKKNNKTRL